MTQRLMGGVRSPSSAEDSWAQDPGQLLGYWGPGQDGCTLLDPLQGEQAPCNKNLSTPEVPALKCPTHSGVRGETDPVAEDAEEHALTLHADPQCWWAVPPHPCGPALPLDLILAWPSPGNGLSSNH